MKTTTAAHLDRQYQAHLKHLKLKGMQPNTIDDTPAPSAASATTLISD